MPAGNLTALPTGLEDVWDECRAQGNLMANDFPPRPGSTDVRRQPPFDGGFGGGLAEIG